MSKLDTPGLQLVSIGEIVNETFFIPYYQRGYRWTERQVTDLLEDILEFTKKPKKEPSEFYCLQPIVVTKKDNCWYVIDGQQRLTTLYIILKTLEDVKQVLFRQLSLFSLSYETRKESTTFLENITKIKKYNDTNVDFYHMSCAYLTIKNWIEQKEAAQEIIRGDFLTTILKTDSQNGIDVANNIRFIWYTVDEQDEDGDKKVFRKINMGKIPLTNAELIKALFFINEHFSKDEKEKRQNQLAYEWNAIEDSLQNDDFWFFLNTTTDKKSTQIEFLFDVLAKNKAKEIQYSGNPSDDYYTFYVFNLLINNKKYSADALWQGTKRLKKIRF